MHPNIVEIGPFVLHWYGLMLALSFVFGIYLSMHRAEKRGIDKNAVMDLAIILVICAIVGSRLQYILTHLHEFQGHWWDAINPRQSDGTIGIGGLSMLGGVVLCIIALVVFCVVKKINMLRLGDAMSPAFGLGIGLTRIGCFMVGCCFGQACDLPWGVQFPPGSPASAVPELQGLHLHPTQLYASLYGFLIFAIVLLLDRKPRSDGFIMGFFFMLYGVARFSVDFVRYYNDSLFTAFGATFTINQLISLVMVVAGLVLVIAGLKMSTLKPEPVDAD